MSIRGFSNSEAHVVRNGLTGIEPTPFGHRDRATLPPFPAIADLGPAAQGRVVCDRRAASLALESG